MFQSKYKNNSEKSTGLLFMRTYHLWHGQVKKALKEIDLTHPQFIVLATIGYLSLHNNLANQVSVSQFSDMDVMTVSQVTRLLLKKELIDRQENPNDSRSKILSLTPKGEETLNTALPIVEKIDQTFFGRLDNQLSMFNQLLGTLEDENG